MSNKETTIHYPRSQWRVLLAQALERSGLTQQQFAARGNISDRHLRRLLAGDHDPDSIPRILEAVGWKVEQYVEIVSPQGVVLPDHQS